MFIRSKILALGILGLGTLIALPTYSQISPNSPNDLFDRNITNPNRSLLNNPVIQVNPEGQNPSGTNSSYPYGSRINESGAITAPGNQVTYPNVGITNGDGSTTYYYPNGTSITIDKGKVPASGAIIR
jgi:hypothetical protein